MFIMAGTLMGVVTDIVAVGTSAVFTDASPIATYAKSGSRAVTPKTNRFFCGLRFCVAMAKRAGRIQ